MDNRFLYMDRELNRRGHGRRLDRGAGSVATMSGDKLSLPMSASDRALVVLIENGGVDLGIPELVRNIMNVVPGGSWVPDDLRDRLVQRLREELRTASDWALEELELAVNRYQAAEPNTFGEVAILRNSTGTAQELKSTLFRLTDAGKVTDVVLLTHGSSDYVSVPGGIDGAKLRQWRQEAGHPLRIRAVYMMNCKGSSLNAPWLDLGAKVVSGSTENNYLPEPTNTFFWRAWKEGETFQRASFNAWQQAVTLINRVTNSLIPAALQGHVNMNAADWDFVKDSRPVVSGNGDLTVSSDDLSYTQTISRSLALTVVSLSDPELNGGAPQGRRGGVSPHGMELIRHWEADTGTMADRVEAAVAAIGRAVTAELSQAQLDALTSFVVNIGEQAFERSTLLSLINAGDMESVPAELRKWVKTRRDGQVVTDEALVERRDAEAELFDGANTATAKSLLRHGVSRAMSAREEYESRAHAGCALSWQVTSGGRPVSRAMFGTGEHVMSGGDVQTVPLHVGVGAGVEVTYGELIAFADLYTDVDELMADSGANIRQILGLVRRSHRHYSGGGGSNPGSDDWDTATGDRYLRLAQDNYAHFSPDILLAGNRSRGTLRQPTNRSVWEQYHRRAIEEATQEHLEHPNSSPSLEGPLIVNAFGDHFLTDAFASGHLINKEAMINVFKANFMSGGNLTSTAESFFDRVADKAFRGEVERRFSGMETTAFPVCAYGWCLRWRPNINSKSRFATLLKEAAKQQPDRIANFAVLALHDFLNRSGVQVTNAVGRSWRLTGDGHVNSETMAAMKAAVNQSAANVTDPALSNSSVDPSEFMQRVWQHVPQPTAAERTRLTNLATEYTDPASNTLSDAAAEIISKQLGAMIRVLIAEKKLKPA